MLIQTGTAEGNLSILSSCGAPGERTTNGGSARRQGNTHGGHGSRASAPQNSNGLQEAVEILRKKVANLTAANARLHNELKRNSRRESSLVEASKAIAWRRDLEIFFIDCIKEVDKERKLRGDPKASLGQLYTIERRVMSPYLWTFKRSSKLTNVEKIVAPGSATQSDLTVDFVGLFAEELQQLSLEQFLAFDRRKVLNCLLSSDRVLVSSHA
ncbi:hypothetical protein Esti_000938 [Eimeria stiedai]